MSALPNPKPLLRLEKLAAGYGRNQVLFDLELSLQPGEVATLLGRNGMGKTTTLRALFGLTTWQRGCVEFQGQPLAALSCDAIARLGLALVPEGRRIFPNLSVRENLTAFATQRHQPSLGAQLWNEARVLKLFPRLAERAGHSGHQLSGGEQQMLAIGRALMTNPLLLILDEATEGLAPLLREEIWQCLRHLKEAGQSILVIDKYVNALMTLADHHTVLERGTVALFGGLGGGGCVLQGQVHYAVPPNNLSRYPLWSDAMFLHITKAEYLTDYKISVSFNDGKSGVADLAGIVDQGVFKTIAPLEKFAEVRLDDELATVVWPGGLDLAPEFVYFQAFKHDPQCQSQFKN